METNLGSIPTYFIGNHYEVSGAKVTKYYYAGSQRIAMNADGLTYFMLGDHLGSTSITTDANGVLASEMKYTAWGEVRETNGTTLTNYAYTGQYSHVNDFGLMYYNARWYDPSLSRFAQADTIVPGGAQGYDRYAYVSNSPINFNDPTGHDPAGNCYDKGYCVSDDDTWAAASYRTEVANNMIELGIYGNGNEQAAMEYVTASECTPYTCSSSQLPQAMMHKYNEYCSGGAWSAKCIQSFWGYFEGILNADGSGFTSYDSTTTNNLAAAILDNQQNPDGTYNPHGGFANDGQGCYDSAGKAIGFCDWANFEKSIGRTFIEIAHIPDNNQDYCSSEDCLLNGPDSYSIWMHDQGNKYFVVMDVYAHGKYCNPPYSDPPYNFCY